ncbi:hypothetical protein BJX99DRAFT_257331 [Aspergillus californicus]
MDALEQEVRSIFKIASDSLRQSLTDNERAKLDNYKTADELIQSMKNETRNYHQSRHGCIDKFCHAVGRISRSLEPYFDVINTCVQSNPEYAGLVWGSIKLVFKICGHREVFFEKLTSVLDNFYQEIDISEAQIRNLAQKDLTRLKALPSWPRLVKALSYLFADIISFCQRVYSLFYDRDKRMKQRLITFGELFWKPFDDHFRDCLESFRKGKRILEREFNAAAMGMMMARHDALDDQIKIVEKLSRRQLDELEDRKLNTIKKWIGAPDWNTALEQARSKRYSNTGSWILDDQIYKSWRAGEPAMPRTMAIHAKPGYGKTVLCTTILDDLILSQANIRQKRNVCFYFFSGQRPDSDRAADAFRAIVTQCIHANRHDHDFLDLALVLANSTGSGQLKASNDEILHLLAMYLQLAPITLLLDGIDECCDPDILLQILSSTFSHANCRTILSSRPTIKLNWFVAVSVVELSERMNFGDIKAFLEPKLEHLMAQGLLEGTEPAANLANKIAGRSGSMFLWASLMVSYLKSEALSPEDRHEAIDNLNLLEGLDGMYSTIITMLRRRFPSKAEWDRVEKLFRWIRTAARPLHHKELRYALGIRSSGKNMRKAVSARQLIPQFDKVLGIMSGALMEIGADFTVSFIHLSVIEFLEQTDGCGSEAMPFLRQHISEAHCQSATDCLLYILHTVKPEPLSGSSRASTNASQVRQRYPFLLYAAQLWSKHAEDALKNCPPGSQIATLPSFVGMFQEMFTFISTPAAVTAWSEASWVFGNPPRPILLPTERLDELKRLNEPAVILFTRFTLDLDRLTEQWGHILLAEPNEIWEPSIPAFLQSPFWIGTKDARLQTISSGDEDTAYADLGDAILISTQTSSNGHEVGIIKAWPSQAYTERFGTADCSRYQDCWSHGWTIRFEVVKIATRQPVVKLTFELPPEEVLEVVDSMTDIAEPPTFRFPVAFSPDLNQVVILGCLLRVVRSNEPTGSLNENQYHCQSLHLWSTESNLHAASGLQNSSNGRPEAPQHDKWYRITFSPTGQYIAVLRGSGQPGGKHFYGRWRLVIYKDHSSNADSPPDYQPITETSICSNGHATRVFAFHPELPMLAIVGLGVTSLWLFFDPGSQPSGIHNHPLSDLEFSACGRYIHGIELEAALYGSRVILSIEKQVAQYHHHHHKTGTSTALITKSLPLNWRLATTKDHFTLLATTTSPSAIESNKLLFTRSSGQGQISMLRQCNQKGTVVLQRLYEDGTAQEECLTRLPSSSTLESSYASLLAPFTGDRSTRDQIQVILNKTAQESYSCGMKDDFKLPALLTRKVSSIPSWMGKRPRGWLIEDAESSNKLRKCT